MHYFLKLCYNFTQQFLVFLCLIDLYYYFLSFIHYFKLIMKDKKYLKSIFFFLVMKIHILVDYFE